MASTESDLHEALRGRAGAEGQIVAFRARAWPLIVPLLLCLLTLLGVMVKLMLSKRSSDPIMPLVAFEAAVIVASFWLLPRGITAAALRGKGHSGYALSRTHLLVVTAEGQSMCVPLSAIAGVEIEKGVPVITMRGSLPDGSASTLVWEVGLFRPLTLVGKVACPTSASRFVREVRGRLGEAVPARPAPAAKRAEAAELSAEGASFARLEQPLTEPSWRGQLEAGGELERLRLGPYELVLVDARSAPAGVIRYTYRLLVLPSGSTAPVFAYNHELSAMGTSCFGAHEGSAHTNLGEAPAEVPLEVFREKALAHTRERLTRPS